MSTKPPKTFHVLFPIFKPTPVNHLDVINNNLHSTLGIRDLLVNLIILIMDARMVLAKIRIKDKDRGKDKDQDKIKVSVKAILEAEADLVVVEEVVKDHDRMALITPEEVEARVHRLNRLVCQQCGMR